MKYLYPREKRETKSVPCTHTKGVRRQVGSKAVVVAAAPAKYLNGNESIECRMDGWVCCTYGATITNFHKFLMNL